MHCHFSGDSEAASEDMVKAAMEKGLDGICFTDHLDFDYREEPGLFLLDVDAYRAEISSLQAKYDGIFPILWGIEVGLQPHVAGKNRGVTTGYPFDFVIGSSHCVDCIDIYYPSFYENTTEEAAYRRYFEAILKNVQTDADYDVYGHLDYIVRYGPHKNEFYSYEAYADIIDEILRALIARGKGIELNTAGFKYGLGHPNPTEDVIRRYRELGGEIITIGADGHKPEHVAYDFAKVAGILRDAGFSFYTVFRQRKPEFYPLPLSV
jgi:histidinol-phosphatase (PHP family)